MPKADLRELKPPYLKLVDLLCDHRLQELGKTGATHIPQEEVQAIENEFKLDKMFAALIADGVLDPFETEEGSRAFVLSDNDGVTEMVFNCLKSVEEMRAYRASLVIEGALGLQIDAHGGNFYEMYRNGHDKRVRLSDREGELLSLLMEHANETLSRESVAERTQLTPKQVSDTLTAIRKKLESLGFSRSDVEEMLRPYTREGLMFSR